MGEFKTTFWEGDRSEADLPKRFEKMFANHASGEAKIEEGGGITFSDGGEQFELTIVSNKEFGMMASYSCFNRSSKGSSNCFYTVGEKERLGDIVDVGDEEFFPIGCFVDVEKMRLVVEDFFSDPTNPSSKMDWIDENEIEWLE